ncbi:hypothetical protein ACTFIY_006397 [Dictyostelium cf. discoideum]
MSDKIILYGDLISQPVRAVYWFLVFNKIDFEFHEILLGKKEARTEEYKKINPLQKMPALKYKGEIYIESHNILRFLSQELNLNQYYGETLIEKTKVDTYLDWMHLGIRAYSQSLFAQKYLMPKFGTDLYNDKNLNAEEGVPIGLKQIENVFLKNGKNKYIVGDRLTIADFSCYSELKQLEGIKYDFSPYKAIENWKKQMESLDGYKEANLKINQVASQQQ